MLFGIPYRPDAATCAIEMFWAIAKRNYRNRADRFKARKQDFYNGALVMDILTGISNEQIQKCIVKGEQSLMNAMPIEPLEVEQ